MKQLLLLIIIIPIFNPAHGQVICIQRGSLTFIETRLDSAILHSQNGDIIYLPGGNIPGSTCTVDKQLTIIGCGYNSGYTYATGTTVVQSITFDNGSDGSMITGTHSTTLVVKSGITITRNQIDQLNLMIGSTNVIISENIIQDLNGSSSTINYTHNVRQNIFTGIISEVKGMYFTNNIFSYSTPSYQFLFRYIESCVFTNNIFSGTYVLWIQQWYFYDSHLMIGCLNNHFEKNIFSQGDYITSRNPNGTGVNNYFNVNPIFSQNYHLGLSCIGINNGTDGTDIGIFGTANPFKEGGLPHNPHYQSIHVTPIIIDQGGTLGVDFKVDAQDR